MKIKNLFKVLVITLLDLSSVGCVRIDTDDLTKDLDTRVVYLKPNQKLVDVDWRFLDVEDYNKISCELGLWTLTREMTPQDSAITYKYYVPEREKEHMITIIESRNE